MAVKTIYRNASTGIGGSEIVYTTVAGFTGSVVVTASAVVIGSAQKVWTLHGSRSDGDNSVVTATAAITEDSSVANLLVNIREVSDTLVVEVEDNGAGVAATWNLIIEEIT